MQRKVSTVKSMLLYPWTWLQYLEIEMKIEIMKGVKMPKQIAINPAFSLEIFSGPSMANEKIGEF